jgi:hypothetical protein
MDVLKFIVHYFGVLTGLNALESIVGVNPSEEAQLNSPLFGID